MRTTLLYCFFIFLGISFQSFSQLYTYKNYNHRDGLNMGSILSLDQSDDGYVWIGTDGAPLIRFDGETFKEIRIKGQDSEHHITDVSYSKDTVFFSSQYKGFYAYSKKTHQYLTLSSNRTATGDAVGIIITDNCKYFISHRRIQSFKNGKTIDIYRSDNSNIELSHYVVHEDRAILFTSKGNFLLSDGKLSPLHDVLKITQIGRASWRERV